MNNKIKLYLILCGFVFLCCCKKTENEPSVKEYLKGSWIVAKNTQKVFDYKGEVLNNQEFYPKDMYLIGNDKVLKEDRYGKHEYQYSIEYINKEKFITIYIPRSSNLKYKLNIITDNLMLFSMSGQFDPYAGRYKQYVNTIYLQRQ